MAQEAAKGNSLVPVAGALFVGLIAGAAFFGNDGEIRKLKRDVEARIAAAESAAAGAAEAATAGATAAVEAAGAAASERVAALEAQLASAQAALDAKLAETAAAVAALAAPAATPAPAPVAAPVETAPVEAAPAEAPAGAAPSGETELALAVGQTGVAGDLRIFMSRIDADAAEAHVRVVGAGAATVGAHSGPAALGNGCALTFGGIDGRTAKLVVACP